MAVRPIFQHQPLLMGHDPSRLAVETAHSVETRWFLPGSPSPRVVSELDARATREHRTDIYLCPSSEKSSVKFRDGKRLEVKRRRWSQWYRLDYSTVARVEAWTKRSFADHEADAGPIGDDPEWVSVHKSRWVLDVSGVAAGHIEIGEFTVANQSNRYWTLGIEVPTETAVDRDAAPLDAVRRGLRDLEPWLPRHELQLSRTASYPAWLRNHSQTH